MSLHQFVLATYVEDRQDIANHKIYIRTRGSMPEEYAGTEPQLQKRGAHIRATKTEVETMVEEMEQRFDVSLTLPFQTVDQTGENACSFLAFSLLCHLTDSPAFTQIFGSDMTWPKIVLGGWKTKWSALKEARSSSSSKGGGMNDISEMLDTLQEVCNDIDLSNLVYVPVKDISEKYYNSAIVDKGTRYPNHLSQIQTFIEDILNTHNYLIINTDLHTRVYISYNETHLLAIDNYPNTDKQLRRMKPGFSSQDYDWSNPLNDSNILDVTVGGLSLVNKFFVYNNVRDLAYFRI